MNIIKKEMYEIEINDQTLLLTLLELKELQNKINSIFDTFDAGQLKPQYVPSYVVGGDSWKYNFDPTLYTGYSMVPQAGPVDTITLTTNDAGVIAFNNIGKITK